MKKWRELIFNKIFGITLLFLFCISTLVPNTSFATANFVWFSATEIRNGNESYILNEDTSTAASADYHFFYTYPDPSNPTGPKLSTPLSVSKSDPLHGTLGTVVPYSTNAAATVNISDPNNVAPKPPQIINKGWISGRIIPDGTISDANLESMVKVGQVSIWDEKDNPVTFEGGIAGAGDTNRGIYHEGLYYYYNGFDLAKVKNAGLGGGINGGLYPGIYKLHFKYSEGADCTDGQLTFKDTSSDYSQAVCRGTLFGEVSFRLDYISGGYGKVTILDGDSEEMNSPVNNNKLPETSEKNNGLNMTASFSLTSPLDAALSSAIKNLASWTETATKWVMGWIDNLLSDTANYVIGEIGCKGEACGVMGPWTVMRNIGLTLLVMALIIIAFANVLQIDIEQYGLNRIIPKIIISIMLAFLSWIVVEFFFDFTLALQKQAIGLLGGSSGLSVLGDLTINTPTTGDIAGKFGAILLLIVILIGALICGVVLFFELVIRIVMLSFLLAVAPLAFILNIVPFTSGLYKRWWSEFFKWMFMGPVAMIIISLGSVIAASVSGGSFGSGEVLSTATVDSGTGGKILIGILIFGASLYLAARIPMQWGGDVMKGWSKLGKKTWDKTGGAALKAGRQAAWNQTGGRITQPLGKAWKGWTGELERARDRKNEQRGNDLLNTISGGKYGTDPKVMENKLFDAEVSEAGKRIGTSTAKDAALVSRHQNSRNQYEKRAIEREMASRGSFEKLFAAEHIDPVTNTFYTPESGHWGSADTVEAKAAAKAAKSDAESKAKIQAGTYLASLEGRDIALEKSVKDNQGEIAVAAAINGGAYGVALKGGFLAGQKGKAGNQKRTQAIEFMSDKDAEEFLTANDVKQILGKDGDSKRTGHLKDMIEKGRASKEVADAYHEFYWGSKNNVNTGNSSSMGYSSGPSSDAQKQAYEDLKNKYQ